MAVDAISFDVPRGEVFGLIGPNGAGKTTTMECVEGLRQPDQGRVRVLGLDPVGDARALQQRIGIQLQDAHLQKRITVGEAIDLWAAMYDRRIDGRRLLDQLGLAGKRRSWFMTLSGGQKQRLFIALALINDPEVVFLDELTTGLDPQARRTIWELVRGIRARGTTVLLTTHSMEEAERLCDRVAIVDHGRLVDVGSPAQLVSRHCPHILVRLRLRDVVDVGAFETLPGVTAVSVDGLDITIRGPATTLVTDTIRAIAARGVEVDDFGTTPPTLEDVFLHLTGHALRD